MGPSTPCRLSRREWLVASVGVGLAAASSAAPAAEAPEAALSDGSAFDGARGLRVRFLGSGAAGWDEAWLKKSPHARRPSSVLLENRVLIDFTACAFDLMPKEVRPEALFLTHSHGDHYDPYAIVRVGVKRVYAQESWAKTARHQISAAARQLNLPAPEVLALPFGRPVTVCSLRFTGVPSIHSTSRVTEGVLERTSMYLVEKGATRLLYATDTAGIPGDAARMIGIEPHVNEHNRNIFGGAENPYVHAPAALTALIMEATDGDRDADFRMFVHSGVALVERTVRALKEAGRLKLPEGETVLLTHLGLKYRDWPSEAIDRELPAGLRAAHDGLELVLG